MAVCGHIALRNGRNLGATIGIIGTLDNAGKVIGPVLGGLLIARFNYALTFKLLGGLLLLGAGLIGLVSLSGRWGRETADVVGLNDIFLNPCWRKISLHHCTVKVNS